MYINQKERQFAARRFREKIRRFVVTEFVKTCDELVIGLQLISRKS